MNVAQSLSEPSAAIGRRGNHVLVTIIVAAVALRLSLFVVYAPWISNVEVMGVLVGDALGYHELARCILELGSFCDNTLRTPGYPALVAAVYAIAGVHPWVVLLLQSLIDALVLLLVYRIGERVFSHRVGLVAAAMLAFDPTTVFNSLSLLSDGLFTLLFVGAVWFFLRGLFDEGWHRMALVGLLLGLATLVRPSGQYLPVLFAAAACCWVSWRWPRRLVHAALVVAVFACTIAPWAYRNHSQFGSPKLSTIQGHVLLNWQVAYFLSWREGVPVREIRRRLRRQAVDAGVNRDGNPFANEAVLQRVALGHIRAHPVEYAGATLRGIAFMYLNVGTKDAGRKLGLADTAPDQFEARDVGGLGELFRQFLAAKGGEQIALAAVMGTIQFIQYMLFALGLLVLWRRRQHLFFTGLVVAMVVYFSAISGINGTARLRIPITPLYLLVGAAFVDAWLRQWRARRDSSGRHGNAVL